MKNWRQILSWKTYVGWVPGAKVRVKIKISDFNSYYPIKDGWEGKLVSLSKAWTKPENPIWFVSFPQYSKVGMWQDDLELI
jgi:hypothetical protein